MPKGGPRLNPGPPPDPNALRRDRPSDRDGWTLLPTEGRQGPAPEWPLSEPSARELEVWAALWGMPQAVAWERMSCQFDVASYVRLLVHGESRPVVAALAEARQLSDRLGLNPAAMLRNRWRVVDDEVAQRRTTGARQPGTSSVRDRLRALDGGTG